MIYTLVCNMPRQIRLEDSSQKKNKKNKKQDQKRGRYRRKIDNKIEETWRQEFLV